VLSYPYTIIGKAADSEGGSWSLINCFFDPSIPTDASFFGSTSEVTISTSGFTWTNGLENFPSASMNEWVRMNPGFCNFIYATGTPTESRTPRPTPTESFLFIPTSKFTNSLSHLPTAEFSLSNHFLISDVFSMSHTFLPSVTFVTSDSFKTTSEFLPSHPLIPTMKFSPSQTFTPLQSISPAQSTSPPESTAPPEQVHAGYAALTAIGSIVVIFGLSVLCVFLIRAWFVYSWVDYLGIDDGAGV
jgi:hypothetical protein